ncbi:MAG: hypothetical protein LC734_02045 [Acidobacteria bacterium]|nr:hypothetical protein [Acidobacteriota bacterium]
MPLPVPAPTAEEIEIVAEIMMLSYPTVALMIAAYDQDIANAKWARTLEDIDIWTAIRDETGDIKRVGDIEFFEGTNINTRLDFRNRLRLRYGQLALLGESGATCGYPSGYAVAVRSDW